VDINIELNTLCKENSLLNIYKNVLKSNIEHLNDFQEIYTDASKNNEGVRITYLGKKQSTEFV